MDQSYHCYANYIKQRRLLLGEQHRSPDSLHLCEMNKPPKPPKPLGQEPEMYDLLSEVKIWALECFQITASREQKKVPMKDLDLRIVWDDVVINHEAPEYYDNQISKLPKSQSLFSTTFRNNTDSEQEYSLHTDRSTRSIAEVEIHRGVIISKEISMKLSLPSNIMEANAGFKHELSLDSSSRQSTEEELNWGIDTKIVVPGRSSAYAEIKVSEEQMTSQFRLLTTMYGRIRVVFLDATRNQAFVQYLESDFGSAMEGVLMKRRPSGMASGSGERPQIWVDTRKSGRKILMIETSGRCMFRFGVHQEVEVNQKEM